MSAVKATAVKVGEFSFNRVSGVFPFAVEPDGTFVVEAFGEEFYGDRLSDVQEQVYQAALALRHEIPFVRTDLRQGVIRGWHAGRDVLLVTYEDGEKDTMHPGERVWRPEEISQERLDRLAEIRGLKRDLAIEEYEITKTANTSADKLLGDAIGIGAGRYGSLYPLSGGEWPDDNEEGR